MGNYEHYSSDGTPWGLSFPSHWQQSKLRHITSKIGSGATPKGGKSVYLDNGTVALIRSLNVHDEGFRYENLAFIDDEAAAQLNFVSVRANDVLLNITGASILRTTLAPKDVLPARVNQHVSILRTTDDCNPGYLRAWLASPQMHRYMYSQSVGSTREAITKAQLQGFPIMLPPKSEQDAIVAFLNTKTAEINGLIDKMAREVELLERYRRELIVHTVTRGLDPDMPMRDSGVEWIGEAPSTWRPLRISALYDLRSQKVSDKEYSPLSITMNGVVPQLETVAKTNDGDNRKLVRSGDFVINSRSDRRGACGISPQDGSCSLINIVLTPKHSINNRYFSYLFRSTLFADEFYRWGHGIHDDVWTTNWNDMKSIQVPVPPLEDQETIANYLDDRMAQTDSTVSGIRKQIELLGKYRKQVISDAVTGKVRVGEVA